jgi:hypothetical protein
MSGEATLFLARIYSNRKDYAEGIRIINQHLKDKPECDKKAQLIQFRNSLVTRLGQKSRRGGR